MAKRNRNIKNIFIKLQMGTNIMANQVKTPIQNYFEKVLYGNLTIEIPPLWFFSKNNSNKPLACVCCDTCWSRSRRKESFVVSMVCGKLNFSINKTYRINPNSKNSKYELDILAHFFFGTDIFKIISPTTMFTFSLEFTGSWWLTHTLQNNVGITPT